MSFSFIVWVLLAFSVDFLMACLPSVNFEPNFPSNDDKSVCKMVCNKNSQYRSFDGTCNNLKNPTLGSSPSAYGRLLNDSYTDDKNGMPGKNGSLPNPRAISIGAFPIGDFPDPVWTMLLMTWGQTIAHDLSHTAAVPDNNAGICCNQGQYTEKEKSDARCAAFSIPPNDLVNVLDGNVCSDFYRTKWNKRSTCRIPAYEPISDATSYMDVSLTYASTDEAARDLREHTGGRLKSKSRNGQEYLPQSHDVKGTCRNTSKSEPCYRAGDPRVNQNTLLTVLQTIYMRQHNRIADGLCNDINPHWSDERCYQEARKIFIAIIQWINYQYYIPAILGQETATKYKLNYSGETGFVNDYNDTVDATVTVEFATAAFRFLHTTVPSNMILYDENRIPKGTIALSPWMHKPSIIEEVDNFDKLSRCLTTQAQYNVDVFYGREIKDYLFGNSTIEQIGQDLRSLDIQRSRDQGLPYYVEVLKACNLGDIQTFSDLLKLMPPTAVTELEQHYKSVGEIELVVAASLERLIPGSLTGPTFQCILAEQFLRQRVADRFFFEKKGVFKLDQLNSIRNMTASRMFCDNVDSIEKMQPDAFRLISLKNSLMPCDELPPAVNLSLWKET